MEKSSHFLRKNFVFLLALSTVGPTSGTPARADAESRHHFLSEGLVRSAMGRSSDAICEFIKDDIFFFQAIYCSATEPSSALSTCMCKTRKPGSLSLTVDEFESGLKELGTQDSEIDEIIQKIAEGAKVEFRDRLFLLALNAIENHEKKVQKAKAIGLELGKEKADQAKIEHTCTAYGTYSLNRVIGPSQFPLNNAPTALKVECTGCYKNLVEAEARSSIRDFAYYGGGIINEVICTERKLPSPCKRRTNCVYLEP